MSQPAIIDYASPASRSSLRLPARSEIGWIEGPRSLRVTQVLAGRGEAILALALAAFTFFLLSVQLGGMFRKWERYPTELGLVSGIMLAELIVAALVIHNTWRKTIITVTPEEMTLHMSAPLGARQRFVMPNEQVAAVTVVDRDAGQGEAVVPELEIRLWSAPAVRLFAGHPYGKLMDLAAAIHRVQPPTPPPLPTRTSVPLANPLPATPLSPPAPSRPSPGFTASA